MTEFSSGQSAIVAHQALISALATMEIAKHCSVLWFDEINKHQLFRELGYASINQYAEQELGFSSTRTGDYLQLCRSFTKLPILRSAKRLCCRCSPSVALQLWCRCGLNWK